MPDAVLGEADEVVLIDLTPEALIDRLRAGKIYPSESIEAALQQLLPDREPAGRCARWRCGRSPQEVESKRLVEEPAASRERARGAASSSPTRRRRSASGCWRWSSRTPASQRLVRRAWRSAQRLGTDLDLLWVKPPGSGPTEGEAARQLDALRQLASVLGAHLLVEEGDDLVATVRRVAARARHHLRPARRPRPRRSLLGRFGSRCRCG